MGREDIYKLLEIGNMIDIRFLQSHILQNIVLHQSIDIEGDGYAKNNELCFFNCLFFLGRCI
jgi:hypothetical protein